MRKGLTEVVFILDRSGSMAGLEKDTIGGYNSMINKQKKKEGEALISTILFDDRCQILHDRVPVDRMKEITEKDYYVRGATALLDAIGDTIQYIGEVHKKTKKADRPEHTMFVIMTDGMENSSRKYSYDKVKTMVEKKKRNVVGSFCSWERIWMPLRRQISLE